MKNYILPLIFLIISSLPSSAQWTTSGNDIFNSNTGNVGIGTSTPGAPLQISSVMIPGSVKELLRLEQRGNGGNELGGEGAAISFYTPMSPSPDLLGAQIYSFRDNGINASPTTSLHFLTNNAGTLSDRLVISGTGNIGIGTTDNSNWNLAASTYKLAVGGSVIATGITVKATGSWPDFVFRKDYQLPPLSSVKLFIERNHHLPQIPSEPEIADAGIDLGKMNRLLLQKMEEMTLYMIQANEKIESLEKQVKYLKKINK